MAQAIDKEQIIIDEFKKLSPEKQQEVLNFIEFLHFKAQKQDVQHKEEKEPISAYEAAKEFAGCVDGGPGDLATNKKYLYQFYMKLHRILKLETMLGKHSTFLTFYAASQ